MLGAINAHRVGYGLGLILAFSAGPMVNLKAAPNTPVVPADVARACQ